MARRYQGRHRFGRIFPAEPDWLAKQQPEPIIEPQLPIIDAHHHLWVVTGASTYKFPKASTPMGKEKLALLAGAGLRILHRWQAGEVMLTLYGT